MTLLILSDNQEYVLERAAVRTGSTGWAADAQAVMFADEDGEIAYAVFQNFSGENVDLHLAMADGRHMTGKVMDALMRIAFQPSCYGLSVIWLPIPEHNIRAQAAALKAGFRFEARRRGYAADGSDAILMAMRLGDIIAEHEAALDSEAETDTDDRPQEAALPEGGHANGRQFSTESRSPDGGGGEDERADRPGRAGVDEVAGGGHERLGG